MTEVIPGQMDIFECIALVEPQMASGTFRDGPLDGQRHKVPEHGPAWVRYLTPEGYHWYAWKKGSKRTYTYVGCN
jgi:hypothetical protein